MRFKKGSKVEVLSNKESSLGAWHCAEIISGNGHTYRVRYDSSLGMDGEAVIERVSRKVVRPCPPTESVDGWTSGELVEVFNAGSWKIAVIVKFLGGEFYLFRLIGSLKEFKAHKSNIRFRQYWQDDGWITIGKGTGNCDSKSKKLSSLTCNQIGSKVACAGTRRKFKKGTCIIGQDKSGEESNIVMSRSLKRSCCSSHVETCARKTRSIEKEGEHQQLVSRFPIPFSRKVDAIAFLRVTLGEQYLNTSFDDENIGYHKMERAVPRSGISFPDGRGEPNEYDFDVSSVGSCSVISNSPDSKLFGHNGLAGPSEDADTLFSDAESSYGFRDEEEKFSIPPKEDERVRIHELELHAYRSTLMAIFASGPLSWEQEALLTNLRISLHISDDEHLVELRKLIST